MADFVAFAKLIKNQFQTLSKNELFVTAISGEDVWNAYLDAFPAGTNEIYRVRREYDGSYDRNVIRRIGNVVSINPNTGELRTVWDLSDDVVEYPFNEVAQHLSALVKQQAVTGLFRVKEPKLGYVSTTERCADGTLKLWNHFHVDIADRHQTRDVGSATGDASITVAMAERAFNELSASALQEVRDLIGGNALYRGAEFLPSVKGFQKLCEGYHASTHKDRYLWGTALASPYARFKNTVIGTLVADLSANVDTDSAVRMFESKVAPSNYKRPTAVVTKGMIEAALKKIQDLDLEPALGRRFARLSDVTVNNVLWADGSATPLMKNGAAAGTIRGILEATVKPKVQGPVEATPIGIDEFMRDVLPKASAMEVLFKGSHQGNLVSITAPEDPNVAPLFKWDNNFAWSYNGGVADSIKARVKAAGGKVDADLRISLAWHNGDDLDLHTQSPYGHVFFGNRSRILDVDMNAGGPTNSKDPVENQVWDRPRNGEYKVWVNQYSSRSSANVGFTVEIEDRHQKRTFTYDAPMSSGANVEVATFTVEGGKVKDLKVLHKALRSESVSQEVWGVSTETFVPVDTIMLSPNHWDGNQTGNRHWFFLLRGCTNPEGTRGIYNEFLRPELEQHRKVFEVLGGRVQCPAAEDQLSGLGFSQTRGDTVTVRVAGDKMNRIYEIQFQ